MHIAIDDTYTQNDIKESEYITGNRRTHVAVIFQDDEVDFIREQMSGCLEEINNSFGIEVNEFHFVDIYNKNPPWDKLPNKTNLAVFEVFSKIYATYRWPVIIQTVDDRTFNDHNVQLSGKLAGFNLEEKSDLSLFMLLCKIKWKFKENPKPLNIYIDEGKGKSGRNIGQEIFYDYNEVVDSKFTTSKEALVQIADFIAYIINRTTNLQIKKSRSETDQWFLDLVSKTAINCEDLLKLELTPDFTVKDIDAAHKKDRQSKGLKAP